MSFKKVIKRNCVMSSDINTFRNVIWLFYPELWHHRNSIQKKFKEMFKNFYLCFNFNFNFEKKDK